ncbi:MAG: FGGY-family carbohydrate kinase, partial [Candidatus Hydrogenedentales bacterium]
IFAWYVKFACPQSVYEAAQKQQTDVHGLLSCKAAGLKPGESGVLALDWWNGNRSILEDADLSGLIVGLTLSTQPHEIYRALLESTAFGTHTIITTLEHGGCAVDELYACGGLSVNAPLLMQIFADVTNREIRIGASDQTTALGSAMWGAVAAGAQAGGYDSIEDAARNMARVREKTYTSDPEANAVYRQLYEEYRRLHDYFGRGGDDVMKNLKALKRRVKSGKVSGKF